MLYGKVIYEQNIDANLTTFPSNYTLRFQCDTGYRLTKPRFVFCRGENWSDHFPQCLKLNCPKPPVLKKALLQIRKGPLINPAIGSEIEYSCSSGYEFEVPSDNILTCALKNNTPTWTGKLSHCVGKKSCPDPEVSLDGSRSGNCCFIGNVVRYSCDKGYKLVGDEFMICLQGGKWNSTSPRCRPKCNFCPDPPEIRHGLVIGEKLGDYYAFSDEVEVICDEGYAFHGENRYVFCEGTYWDVEFGECRDTQEQAEELKRFEAKTADIVDIQRTLNLPSPRRLILYFIFDVSECVGFKNFRKSIRFAQALVKEVKVSEKGTRVGAFTSNSKTVVEFIPMSYATTEDVLDHLDKLEYKSDIIEVDSTSTVWDIPYLVREYMGYETKSVAFILTDGKANMDENTKYVAKFFKSIGFKTYCIGITGSIKHNELYDLVSAPIDEHVFILND